VIVVDEPAVSMKLNPGIGSRYRPYE